MRYTETRLSPISHESLLGDISEALVDFIDNFDSSQQEPIVLPAQLPNLLLNGSSGIAVGMATNIPPHNMAEVIDGLIALIDRPNLSEDDLFRLIPGPDFPTGGEIVGTEGIYDAYRTGRGSIPIRGVTQFEEIRPGRGRQRRNAIIITELPYQVNKAGWIEKVAQLVNAGRLDGIADIRDESDREGMRVVIELKREAQAHRILQDLYRMTPLQNNFGVIMLALDNGQPRQMPLREILQAFFRFSGNYPDPPVPAQAGNRRESPACSGRVADGVKQPGCHYRHSAPCPPMAPPPSRSFNASLTCRNGSVMPFWPCPCDGLPAWSEKTWRPSTRIFCRNGNGCSCCCQTGGNCSKSMEKETFRGPRRKKFSDENARTRIQDEAERQGKETQQLEEIIG